MVVLVLLKIKFGDAQISVLKIVIPTSKTACINSYLSITNFDIFRLGYIFTHSIGQELVYIDPFLANVPVLYALKTKETKRLLLFSEGIKMGAVGKNGLTLKRLGRGGGGVNLSPTPQRGFLENVSCKERVKPCFFYF